MKEIEFRNIAKLRAIHDKYGIVSRTDDLEEFDKQKLYDGMKEGAFKKILVIGSQRMSCKKVLNYSKIFESVHARIGDGLPEDFQV